MFFKAKILKEPRNCQVLFWTDLYQLPIVLPLKTQCNQNPRPLKKPSAADRMILPKLPPTCSPFLWPSKRSALRGRKVQPHRAGDEERLPGAEGEGKGVHLRAVVVEPAARPGQGQVVPKYTIFRCGKLRSRKRYVIHNMKKCDVETKNSKTAEMNIDHA